MDNLYDRRERTVYVAMMHRSVTDDNLYDLFLKAGPIEKVIFKAHCDGSPQHALVVFRNVDSVTYAMTHMQGTLMNGLPITIRPLRESSHQVPMEGMGLLPQHHGGTSHLEHNFSLQPPPRRFSSSSQQWNGSKEMGFRNGNRPLMSWNGASSRYSPPAGSGSPVSDDQLSPPPVFGPGGASGGLPAHLARGMNLGKPIGTWSSANHNLMTPPPASPRVMNEMFGPSPISPLIPNLTALLQQQAWDTDVNIMNPPASPYFRSSTPTPISPAVGNGSTNHFFPSPLKVSSRGSSVASQPQQNQPPRPMNHWNEYAGFGSGRF